MKTSSEVSEDGNSCCGLGWLFRNHVSSNGDKDKCDEAGKGDDSDAMSKMIARLRERPRRVAALFGVIFVRTRIFLLARTSLLCIHVSVCMHHTNKQ